MLWRSKSGRTTESWIHNWLIHRIPPSKKTDPGGPATHPFPFTFLPLWHFIYRSAFKDEAKLLRRRLLVYFSAHGSLVPGNKMPFTCALCLIQGSKAVHAYIIGGLFLDFFSLFLTVQFICLLVQNRRHHSPRFLLSSVQSSSHFLHHPDFISWLSPLICTSLLLLLVNFPASHRIGPFFEKPPLLFHSSRTPVLRRGSPDQTSVM